MSFGPTRPAHHLAPYLDVRGRVSDDGLLARGAGGSVDLHDVLHGGAEHPERVCLAKVVLHQERELREIIDPRDVFGADTGFVPLAAVGFDRLIGALHDSAQPLILQVP